MNPLEPSEPLIDVMVALPRDWHVEHFDPKVRAVRSRASGLAVIETLHRERDGRRWHHISVSRRGRMPSYDDLQLVRRLFIGETVECYQVFPPKDRWVNEHPFTLHLWRCLDAPEGVVLPDFRHEGHI